jgi:hypothetical protein
MVNAIVKFIDKTKNRYDVYADSSGPSVMIGNKKLAKKFFEFKNRGGNIRYIAEITKDNYELYKKIMEHVELKHFEETKGYFRVNETEYQYYISFPSSSLPSKRQQDFILVSTTNNEIVKQQQAIFEILWNKAVSAEQKIKDIENNIRIEARINLGKEMKRKKKIQLWSNRQKSEYAICLEGESKILAATTTNQMFMSKFTRLVGESEVDHHIKVSEHNCNQKLHELIENEKEKEMNKRMLLKLRYFIVNDDTQGTSITPKKHEISKTKLNLNCRFCKLQFPTNKKRKEHELEWHSSQK